MQKSFFLSLLLRAGKIVIAQPKTSIIPQPVYEGGPTWLFADEIIVE